MAGTTAIQGRRGLAQLAVLGGGGILLLGQLGRLWPEFDIFSHFTLQAAGALTGGVLSLLARRWSLRVLAGVAVLTLGLPPAIAWFATGGGGVQTTAGAATLKVVSLNTWHRNQDHDRLVAFLEGEDADIVVMYEFGPDKKAVLERLKTRYPHQAGCWQRWFCSVVLLSKRPWSASGSQSRAAGPGPPLVWARFGDPQTGLTVIGVHMQRPIESAELNLQESGYVADAVRRREGPVLIAGDFNVTSWSESFRRFRERSGLRHMRTFLPTWPAWPRGLPQLDIDHMFASPGITFESVYLGPSVGSDHRPLVALVRVPSG